MAYAVNDWQRQAEFLLDQLRDCEAMAHGLVNRESTPPFVRAKILGAIPDIRSASVQARCCFENYIQKTNTA